MKDILKHSNTLRKLLLKRLFYVPWFLQSSLAAEAPIHGLEAMKNIRQLMDICKKDHMINKEDESMLLALRAAEAFMKNMYGHLVYFSEKNIVFVLAAKVMTDEDKSIILTLCLGFSVIMTLRSFHP